jgi:exopolysaccharide production protein ExoZ
LQKTLPADIKADIPHIATVDAARGAMAFAVMAYHLLSYQRIVTIDRVAYYAVYGFFVISGFSLYVRYRDSLVDMKALRAYLIRRFFRIAPLFYCVVALQLLLEPRPAEWVNRLLLNLTFAFGLANPGANSLITGGWSIGIEMVFYLVFPIMLAVSATSLPRLLAIAAVGIAAALAFINTTASANWVTYSQPVAFFGYFAAGAALGEVFVRYHHLKGSLVSIVASAVCLLPFLLVQSETSVGLLVGWRGLLLMASAIALISAIAFLPEPTGRLLWLAQLLGALSYPVYLLHPVVYAQTEGGKMWRLPVTVVATVVLAYLINRYVEWPARRYGGRLALSH